MIKKQKKLKIEIIESEKIENGNNKKMEIVT